MLPIEAVVVDLPEETLIHVAQWVRLKAFEAIAAAGNGHLGAAGSSAEMMTALYFGGALRSSPPRLQSPWRDRVLVRGHLGPLRAAVFTLLGHVEPSELSTYRQIGSRLQGHEDQHLLPCVDISPSGSLGMLLSFGVGIAVSESARSLGFRTVVFLGDGEEQEGNVAEAARHAASLRLGNLVAILDRNKKMLSGATADADSVDVAALWSSYGWRVSHISNGHDVSALRRILRGVLDGLEPNVAPHMVIVETVKGQGLEGSAEHVSGYHTLGVTPASTLKLAIDQLNAAMPEHFDPWQCVTASTRVVTAPKEGFVPSFGRPFIEVLPTDQTSRDPTAAQTEYFRNLSDLLIADDGLGPAYFLTADVTYYSTITEARIDQAMHFFNVGLREQHALGMAHGIATTEPYSTVIVNAGDAFTYRPMDQLSAIAQAGSRVVIIGDVAGLTEARNGASHQSAGQPGALLAMPGLTMLEPADTIDLFACLNWSISSAEGPVFIRVSRGAIPAWRGPAALEPTLSWSIARSGGSRTEVSIVVSGPTVVAAVQAAVALERDGITAQVVNVVNQRSLDDRFVSAGLGESRAILCVYNGAPHVLAKSVALAMVTYGCGSAKFAAVGFERGTSGAIHELFAHYKIDAAGIEEHCRTLVAL